MSVPQIPVLTRWCESAGMIAGPGIVTVKVPRDGLNLLAAQVQVAVIQQPSAPGHPGKPPANLPEG